MAGFCCCVYLYHTGTYSNDIVNDFMHFSYADFWKKTTNYEFFSKRICNIKGNILYFRSTFVVYRSLYRFLYQYGIFYKT